MPRFLPRLPQPLYIALRLVFMSRLTPVLVLLIAAVAFLLHAVLPHEPSQAEIVQAFSGYKTKSFEAGPLPFRNIAKKTCNRVTEANGYLCEVQYTMQRLRAGPPDEYTQVFRLFKVEGGSGAWGQQSWNADVRQYTQQAAAADAKWREGHALWTLIGYTIASVIGAVMLCSVLPAVPWNGAGMNERATPWAGRSIRSGSSGADNVADFITTAANSLTPAGAMGLFSLALGIGGFMLGSWMLPQLFIDLRVMGWIERLCLLTAGLSMSAVGFCLPMLLVRLAALSVVVLALYAVFVLPAAWIFTGSSPAQTVSKNMDSIGGLFTTSQPSVAAGASKPRDGSAPLRRQGFEGYQQVFAF